MFLEELREKTAPYHLKIEQNERLNKLVGALTRQDYVDTLKKFYGFYQPLETQTIPAFLNQNNDFQKFYFPKLNLLKKDLDVFEPAREALELCPFTPNPGSPFGWLGVLYTLEGSCHGRAMMWPHIQQQLLLEGGGTFFGSASHHLNAHWKAFCKDMSEQVNNESEKQEVITGAIETFVSLDEWFKR